MLYLTIIALAFSDPGADCDVRATIAGELMFLHQSGVSAQELWEAASFTRMPRYADTLVRRVLAAEATRDASAREMAAFHFAASIYGECAGSKAAA